MKIFTIAGPKGGCGKSVVASALAVRASAESNVAMIDLDEGQGTLTDWWIQRGEPKNPFLYDESGTLDSLITRLSTAVHSGRTHWDHCVIDGPPYDQDLIEMSVLVADAVLIPVKLSYFDAAAIDSITGMCERRGKPWAFVINEFDDRKSFANANAIPLAMLEARGRDHILKTRITYDPKHRVGQIEGKTGAELSTALAKEIDALWHDVKELVGIRKPAKGGRRG